MSAPSLRSGALVLRLLAAVLLLTIWLPASAPAAGPETTRTALQRQMRWAGPSSGALVMDLDAGTVLYSSKPDAARVPASVEKLYTTSTALLKLGAEATLETTVLAEQPLLPDGVLEGDLYLRGTGDPTLAGPGLEALAGELAAAGLVEVTGRVIGDESRFDALRGPPSSRFQTSGYVGPLSALTYNRGRTGLRRPYFQASPGKFAAEAFARALKKEGVKVAVKRTRTGETPAFATSLAAWKSPTMAELARRANVPSDNFIAETLLKVLGESDSEPGTTARGAAVVQRTMSGLGLEPRVVDGSGLSRGNRTTPRQLVRLLSALVEDPVYADFRASLAVAGRSGTLHDRMRRSPARDRCRAKTGTLRSVSTLAGYCQTRGGALVAFAILMNGVNPYGARTLQDRMLTALAKYGP
jgi:D-alanyl-D-alanine carboxypeptidase/D-alanyl-D-alanine-endopeptidase (penicillin-binding protein 4)